jgi:biotin-(acetyl-CoA carboxylase) ligase
VGGILCEARWQGAGLGWIAVGLGLNVRNQLPDEVVPGATALSSRVPALNPESLVGPLTAALRALPRNQSGLTAEEMIQFAGRDWLKGRPMVEPEAGLATGVEPDGRLRVRRPNGETVLIRSGTVLLQGLA